jgi:hypothetical protein
MPELSDWNDWKSLCALDRCAEETRACLSQFAQTRFRDYQWHIHPESHVPDAMDCFRLFEIHCYITVPGDSEKGKNYKDWIFLRLKTHAGNARDIIEAGASLRIRETVRDLARAESDYGLAMVTGSLVTSLDRPREGNESSTLYDSNLLPPQIRPDEEAALRELLQIAGHEADALFPNLSEEEKLAATIGGLGLSFTDPDVHVAAQIGRAQLYAYRAALRAKVEKRVSVKFQGESEAALQLLVELIHQQLQHHTVAEAQQPLQKPENRCRHVFELFSRRTDED